MKGDYLGAFEELVLRAVDGLAEAAYGANLQRLLEREARRVVSLGAVHTVLERLEAKGLVLSADSAPTGERGGRRRRVFRLTAAGRRTLCEADSLRRRLSAFKEARE
ncbi:MAG TPA: helix-turn-helix transcriptional regulator [Vicinamibacterales bacterium]|nr:helix-turn-helix transcriptional regulator [Vicinamibacterales bacterium]